MLTISVLSKSNLCALTNACLNNVIAKINNVTLSLAIGNSDLPKARSTELTRWYDSASPDDNFMFIDADQLFTSDDINRSLELVKKYDVVCGAYPRKNGTITVEPSDYTDFMINREGPLIYGSTGFMMMSYKIVNSLVVKFKNKIKTTDKSSAYPFFYELIVKESFSNQDLWLGEDFSFCWLVRQEGGVVWGYISDTIGHIVTTEKYIQPLQSKNWESNSIVIYCMPTVEKWNGNSIKTGIGGSETAVILLSEYWSTKGYKVTVFCSCEKNCTINNVDYKNNNSFLVTDIFNVFICWRNFTLFNKCGIKAKKVIIDLHDIIDQNILNKTIWSRIDHIFVKSEFHKSIVGVNKKISVIPNGGACDPVKIEKDPFYLVYSSSYDRGLLYMLKWGWPIIKKYVPRARLGIFYGWNIFDLVSTNKQLKNEIVELMKQDGIVEHGRVPRDILLKEKAKASIHYYIGDFPEIDCISVRESASLGAIPVVSSEMKVFTEKPYCITIDGNPSTKKTQEFGAYEIVRLLDNQNMLNELRENIDVSCETWERIGERWIEHF